MRTVSATEMRNVIGGVKVSATVKCSNCGKKFTYSTNAYTGLVASLAKSLCQIKARNAMTNHYWKCINR